MVVILSQKIQIESLQGSVNFLNSALQRIYLDI